jgi:hypothetical protein
MKYKINLPHFRANIVCMLNFSRYKNESNIGKEKIKKMIFRKIKGKYSL